MVLSILVVNEDKNKNLPNINVIYQASNPTNQSLRASVINESLYLHITSEKKEERWLQNIPNNCQSVRQWCGVHQRGNLKYRKISPITNWPRLGQFTIGQISELMIGQTPRLFGDSQKLSFLSARDFEGP